MFCYFFSTSSSIPSFFTLALSSNSFIPNCLVSFISFIVYCFLSPYLLFSAGSAFTTPYFVSSSASLLLPFFISHLRKLLNLPSFCLPLLSQVHSSVLHTHLSLPSPTFSALSLSPIPQALSTFPPPPPHAPPPPFPLPYIILTPRVLFSPPSLLFHSSPPLPTFLTPSSFSSSLSSLPSPFPPKMPTNFSDTAVFSFFASKKVACFFSFSLSWFSQATRLVI